ncbi:MAG: AmmeMemoRadiSam system protein B [Candidatus Berkelbacteria bacterium]|nr:AmmeMemoRadiSam system protein B [Candidatus Berkelbacteria bacterium]
MIVFAGIVPHPPLALPEIGKEDSKKVKKTADALERLAEGLNLADPDTIIVVSPHMVHYPHLFNVCGMPKLSGTFEGFGWIDYHFDGKNDTKLAAEIVDKSENSGLPAILYDNGDTEYELDHGVMVPLHFLLGKIEHSVKILPMGYSIASRAEHFAFGQVISEVCNKKSSNRIAIIASGDLSHRLLDTPPAGEKTNGREFDKELIASLKKGDEYSILNMDEEFVEKAGECGYRSILIMLGAISGRNYAPKLYSYEGPFGVGYAVFDMGIEEI